MVLCPPDLVNPQLWKEEVCNKKPFKNTKGNAWAHAPFIYDDIDYGCGWQFSHDKQADLCLSPMFQNSLPLMSRCGITVSQDYDAEKVCVLDPDLFGFTSNEEDEEEQKSMSVGKGKGKGQRKEKHGKSEISTTEEDDDDDDDDVVVEDEDSKIDTLPQTPHGEPDPKNMAEKPFASGSDSDPAVTTQQQQEEEEEESEEDDSDLDILSAPKQKVPLPIKIKLESQKNSIVQSPLSIAQQRKRRSPLSYRLKLMKAQRGDDSDDSDYDTDAMLSQLARSNGKMSERRRRRKQELKNRGTADGVISFNTNVFGKNKKRGSDSESGMSSVVRGIDTLDFGMENGCSQSKDKSQRKEKEIKNKEKDGFQWWKI